MLFVVGPVIENWMYDCCCCGHKRMKYLPGSIALVGTVHVWLDFVIALLLVRHARCAEAAQS